MTHPLIHAKVCVVGESSVGKTSFINKTLKKADEGLPPPPTVSDVYQYKYNEDGYKIDFEIWDTAGSEDYRTLVPLYWQKANVILVFYDITKIESYNALNNWAEFIPEAIFNTALVVLVGNKLDLNDSRVIQEAKAESFSLEKDFSKYFEVSAKTGEGVDNLWKFIAESPEVQNIETTPCITDIPCDQTQSGNENNGIVSNIMGYIYDVYQYIKSFF